MWHQIHENGTWSGFQWNHGQPPGGSVTWDQPSAVWRQPGELFVYVRGNDLAAWQKTWFAGSGWWGWVSRGGAFLRTPTVTGRGPNNLFIYGVGMDHRLWGTLFTGVGFWPGWEPFDKGVWYASNVAAVHDASDHFIDVVGVSGATGDVQFITRPW